jgi:hypothetical protein
MDVTMLRDVPVSAYFTFFGIMALILLGTMMFNHSPDTDEVEWERLIDEWRAHHYT